MSAEKDAYASAGVNYELLDPFKRAAQKAAADTEQELRLCHRNVEPVSWTRGESAFAVELPGNRVMAHVEEGLGTKNLVADAMERLTGKTYYGAIAQDTVAMIVNDMATIGIPPLMVAMHLAVGDSEWLKNAERGRALIEGWQHACRLAGCVWSGGETPTLKDIVQPGTCVLSGSAVGYGTTFQLLHPENIGEGDLIIFFASSGIHANGLTLARKIADTLPEGYLTKLDDGQGYGEALLAPTHIYSRLDALCHELHVFPRYGINITGHGLRKLMRAPQNLAYVVDHLPEPHPVFRFIQKHAGIDDREMYGTFNMGVGYALIARQKDAESAVLVAKQNKIHAWIGGHVEASPTKRVVLKPLNLTFEADSLQVR